MHNLIIGIRARQIDNVEFHCLQSSAACLPVVAGNSCTSNEEPNRAQNQVREPLLENQTHRRNLRQIKKW